MSWCLMVQTSRGGCMMLAISLLMVRERRRGMEPDLSLSVLLPDCVAAD